MEDKTELVQRLSELPATKRELLRNLLAAKARAGSAIPRRDRSARIPLSFSQQRLWILDQFVERETYTENAYVPLAAAIDLTAVRKAVNEIVRRHEILRTTFHAIDGEPYQKVHDSLTIDIPLVELRGLDPAGRAAEAIRRIAEGTSVPFDLARGPLLRGAMYRLDANEHLLALTLHHIVCDAWSFGILTAELTALYTMFALGQQPALPELPIQYGDFAVWQRARLTGDRLETQLRYWRAQLAGIRSLDLPSTYPRPLHFTYRGAQLPAVIEASLLTALTALAERHDATLHMLLLATLFVLLHRYTGDDDLAVGTPSAGRTHKELERLIGFFVNMQVIRADLSGDPSFLEALARVRQLCLAAYGNQDVPFERLVDELSTGRDASRGPLAQVVFQLYQRPGAVNLDSYVLPLVPAPAAGSKFDLVISMVRYPDEARGFVEYNVDLFDADRIRRFFAHYLHLLKSIVGDPAATLSRLNILPDDERALLASWNRGAGDYPRDSNLVAQFRLQAARNASRTAVQYGEDSLTYAELADRADALAAELIARGVRPGDCVGLLMTRGLELPAAMIGILAAGAFYVPLDPRYPDEYRSHQVADSGAKIVVTTAAHAAVAERIPLPRSVLEELAPARVTTPDIAPAATAWLLYTSGTTGKPKGVPITHRAALRLVHGLGDAPLGPDDTVLQLAPITFDASVGEIWFALLNGAKLVIHPPELTAVETLGAFIREHGITWTFLTTSLFRQSIETCAADLRGVRHLLTGGEVMHPATMQAAWKALPRTQLLHVYGPTECTTFATSYKVANVEEIRDTVPIGKPLGNTTIHILDPHGNPVPIGIPGEIYIGGDGVAAGYWNRPDLTQRSFVADPSNPGGLLYRTGDIARFRPDGNVEFIGRRDRQVKVSGFRIELGELEGVIAAHPVVSGAAAFLLGDHDGEKRIAAFAETLPGRTLDAAALRGYLATALPKHMIPSHLETIDRLPLTANGKVDVVELTRRASSSDGDVPDRIEPATALEQLLAGIWKELLHVPRVGVTDDFFALGGHSLVATRLLSRTRQTLEGEITMREFFDDPTIRGLAAVLSKDERVAERAEILLKVSVPRELAARASAAGE